MGDSKRQTYQNPLDWFLRRKEDDYETRLDFVARQFAAQPFQATIFRSELIAKLRGLRYSSPHSALVTSKTFYQVLKEAGVLGKLLDRDTLENLWKCLLLKKIVERDRQLEETAIAVSGYPLKFHERMAKELFNSLFAIRAVAATYEAHELLQELDEKLSYEFRNHINLALHLRPRYQGSRAELLSGRPKKEISSEPRDEERASQMAIYRELEPKLLNQRTEKRGISSIFLCQLSELISAPPLTPGLRLSDGQTLQRALTRSGS